MKTQAKVTVIRSDERGSTRTHWLNGKHSFSFGNYVNPQRTNHGVLRVLNEDVIEPDSGFQTHGHRDMEIVTYIISGELTHEDSLGTRAVLRAGDLQRMSAGTGIRHSEINESKD